MACATLRIVLTYTEMERTWDSTYSDWWVKQGLLRCFCAILSWRCPLSLVNSPLSPRKWASQVALVVKILPANAGDLRDTGSIPGLGRSLGGGHANYSSILAWRIPCIEDPDGLQSTVTKSWTRLKWLNTCNTLPPKERFFLSHI